MRFMVTALLVIVLVLTVGTKPALTQQSFPTLPPGVYGCIGALVSGVEIGTFSTTRQIQAYSDVSFTFGILDGNSYANFDGKTGHYRYEPTTGLLKLVDGPLAGVTYKRLSAFPAFRLLDRKGALTPVNCPKEGTKDPHKHPW